ncbi:MAG TPA: indolepyruvate ferredoxin oxidoreductase subunit alpha [Chloroflexota bacterium]
MGRNYSPEILAQLRYGRGQVLTGDTALVILKALLESGVSYLGGYPGSPTASLYDAQTDSYEDVLAPMGIYFEGSGNEASAAALIAGSINHPMRGAVGWKFVGTNVAADALAHIAASGLTGGAVCLVGEDSGMDSSSIAERTLPYAHKSNLPCVDPRGDPQLLHRMIKDSFGLSEAAHEPVLFLIQTRAANMKGSVLCDDNVEPAISTTRPLPALHRDVATVPLGPPAHLQQHAKYAERMPAARQYVLERSLNELFPGDGRRPRTGLITHGIVFNTAMRALHLMGEAGLDGSASMAVLQLNVISPLVPEQLAEFLGNKDEVLVAEEAMPNLLEEQIRAIAQRFGLSTRIYGKDLLPADGEYTPAVLVEGLGRFLGRPEFAGKLAQHTAEIQAAVSEPLAQRHPIFCTGCPERPIYSALKIMNRQFDRPYYAGDIGCYGMGVLPPFNMNDSITGMGTGLATTGAMSRMTKQKTVAFMGDGTFWHSGLTTSVANAVYNNSDAVMVLFENGWTSMTGQQENPASGRNIRGESSPKMDAEETLKGMGVTWVERVNPYDVHDTMKVLSTAFTTEEPGLKVIISDGECMLQRQRWERPLRRQRLAEGKSVVEPRYGVDDDVCTGDHVCIRHNGCPSLTLKPNPNPLKADEVVTIDSSCVGCGLCGEVAHAAILCPSFYKTEVVSNPSPWQRLLALVNRLAVKATFGLAV